MKDSDFRVEYYAHLKRLARIMSGGNLKKLQHNTDIRMSSTARQKS